MATPTMPHVQTSIQGRIGRVHLNRPEKINALTVEMITAVRAALDAWREDREVVAVLIDGAGDRGLCAGGDIAAVYDGIRSGSPAPEDFWADEYRMNLDISEYPLPIVAIMHGITFGGGIGISGHASIRVVTDGTQLAMPETAIGLSPDVGGLYLLSRLPGELGTHLALSGARLGPGDAVAAGLADLYVPQPGLGDFTRGVLDAGTADDVRRAAAGSSATPPASETWAANRAWIDTCYAGSDVGQIVDRLRAHPAPAARGAADTLATMSPTALAVTLRALRHAATMTLAEVLDQDLVLSTRFAAHHDFAEGIRARIIDKDGRPAWQPAELSAVTPADVDAFFRA